MAVDRFVHRSKLGSSQEPQVQPARRTGRRSSRHSSDLGYSNDAQRGFDSSSRQSGWLCGCPLGIDCSSVDTRFSHDGSDIA